MNIIQERIKNKIKKIDADEKISPLPIGWQK